MYVNRHETPVLYSATLICLNYTALSQTPYRSFYEDILREDILLDVLIETGVETYICIRDKYCPLAQIHDRASDTDGKDGDE